MRLYLARHGEAAYGHPDESRTLTDWGNKQTQANYRHCAPRFDVPLAGIVSSPLVRARQTAAIALVNLPTTAVELLISPQLHPETPVADTCAMLAQQTAWPLLLVAHQPLIGKLLAWFCDDSDLRYQVNTSSLFALEMIAIVRGGGTLLWQQQ